MKLYRDRDNDLWWEVRPGEFLCSTSWRTALEELSYFGQGHLISLVNDSYGPVTELDIESSASIQNYIETGEYLPIGEA